MKPSDHYFAVKIPDATPQMVQTFTLSDEQILLAIVRYNRLIDIFLGLTTYSLQNHLRTRVKGMGQIQIDEIYVGFNRNGAQYVIPVQADGGTDRPSPVQAMQNIACCQAKFPELICRPISAQFMDDRVIALFELTIENGNVLIVEERHYRLVPAEEIDRDTLRLYSRRS